MKGIIDIKILKPWTEALNSFYTGLGAALTVLTGLKDYVTPGEDALREFREGYEYLLREFADWVEDLPAAIDVTVVKPWAEALGALFSGLESAVKVLSGVGALFHPSKLVLLGKLRAWAARRRCGRLLIGWRNIKVPRMSTASLKRSRIPLQNQLRRP